MILSVLSITLNILIFLFVLGLVICIHELGHLYFAKKAGILCYEFAFGMGPRLYSKKIGETVYSIRAFPLGGFVSMAGEEIQSELVKPGDNIRLLFDESGNVSRIILNADDPRFLDALYVHVERVDLSGMNGNTLFINEYNVLRTAAYINKKEELQIAPFDRRALSKPIGKRFMTMFGGPMMNLLLAIVIYLVLAFSYGVPDLSSTVISAVTEGAPAYDILQAGDEVVSINGVDVYAWSSDTEASIVSELSKYQENDSFVFTVIRDGEEITLDPITPQYVFYVLGFANDPTAPGLTIAGGIYQDTVYQAGDILVSIDGTSFTTWNDVITYAYNHTDGSTTDNPTTAVVIRGDQVVTLTYAAYGEDVLSAQGYGIFSSMIGISSSSHFSFFGALKNAGANFVSDATSIYKTLGLLFSSDQVGVGDLSGFVGMYTITSTALSAGVISFLSWVAFLSVNLGILNLLPIPALDGGWILFLGIEAVTKKRIKPEIQNTIIMVTFFLLLGLLVFVNINDIIKLF